MVHRGVTHYYSSVAYIIAWMDQNKETSLVLTPNSMLYDSYCLHSFGDPRGPRPAVSIVICTYGRPGSLSEALKSLSRQTFRDFEILLITEKGNLAELRHKGLMAAAGDIVSFIDDDVYCPPDWLRCVTQVFKESSRPLGVTGPTVITDEYRMGRDLFKYRLFKRLYDWAFLGNLRGIPGLLSTCGAPTYASNDKEAFYNGPCHYLECCNMSVKKEAAIDVGGFDTSYTRTSEWSEVDFAFRLRDKGRLIYRQRCNLFHRPSKQGIYNSRLATGHRWENFMRFQRTWYAHRGWRTYLYRVFVWAYLKMKNTGMI